ncbi:MAG: hypothetical protein NE327_22620 [Lentisphaeraceae bacterium]|nr:hypothetical protein [Lentisphaeraceae bacterium]
MIEFKLLLALILLISSLGLFEKLSDFFKPLLNFYIFISIVCFYLLFREAFIIYYSGVEIMKEGQLQELQVSENWDLMLILVSLLYSLPFSLVIKKLSANTVLVFLFISISVIPDLGRRYFWDQVLVYKKVNSEEGNPVK